MQGIRRYPLKFAQAQLILNAFSLLEFVPFLRTRKPELEFPLVELEALRERVRAAKATVLTPGIPCTRSEYDAAEVRELAVHLTPPELDAVLVALSASLAEAAAGNAKDVRVVVGPLNEIEDLARSLARQSSGGSTAG